MLTISKPLSAGQAQTYHAKEFTAAEQNYWKQGGEIEGEWHGKLAAEFGLAGAVSSQDFSRLSEGQHPQTGDQLVHHRKVQDYLSEDGKTVTPVEHRAGWDATFSAPKSISLTALVGGDDRVRHAHREAVSVALNELERFTQARIGGNNAPETTGKFIAAKFEHDTSRPVNGYAAPQLHTHAVIFNMTRLEDGSTRALQPRGLFESQQFATAVYQSELTYRLRNLGYEIESGRSGAPEIKGYSPEYLAASSPRRQQIEEALVRSGRTGAEAAQIAAHTTRDRKGVEPPEEVMAAHRRLAAEYGNQARRVVRESQERALGFKRDDLAVQNVPGRAHEAVTFARDRNVEREAVTDERKIMRDALRRGMGRVTYGQVRGNFEQRVSAGEFQQVQGTKHSSGRHFTTDEAISSEREVLRTMQAGRDRAPEIATLQQISTITAERPKLTAAQRSAIELVLTSTDQVQGIQGLAGTGKTTTLAAIRQAAEASGYAVEGFAPTSRAARQLRDAGVSADTLQGFLVRGGQERASQDPTSRHLYMVDESSLASTKQMRDFLAKIGPQDRVLLVGDTRQHQGVDAGKPFEDLQQAGMRTAQLDQIIRQKDPGLLAAVERFSRNETVAGVKLLQQQGRITEIPEQQARIESIAKSYAASPASTIIVSPDNASRILLNQAVRQELQTAGVIGTEDHSFRVLAARSDMTGPDRKWAAHYDVGDVLHYHRGSKETGLERNEYARVVATDPRGNTLVVEKENGLQVSYDPSRLKGVTAYREHELSFALGDRLQFTAPDKELGVANRDIFVIGAIGRDSLTVQAPETGQSFTFDPKAMPHFDHGYAMTSHSAQGLTTERVLVNIDTNTHPDLINNRLAYVSVSRASLDAQVFTNDAGRLSEALSRDVSKSSAVIAIDHQPSTKENAMPSFEKDPLSLDPRNQEQQTIPFSRSLPSGIYAAQLSAETIQQDVESIRQAIAQRISPETAQLNVVDEHWTRGGEQVATVAHVYASELYQSVAKHPDLPLEQRIEQLQPTAGEQLRWDPLVKVIPIEVADTFSWAGSNGTVQSYEHELSGKYLHIDGSSGQFYDRNKNPIAQDLALASALSDVSITQQKSETSNIGLAV